MVTKEDEYDPRIDTNRTRNLLSDLSCDFVDRLALSLF